MVTRLTRAVRRIAVMTKRLGALPDLVFADPVAAPLTEWVVARASATLLVTNEPVAPNPGATAQPAPDAREPAAALR